MVRFLEVCLASTLVGLLPSCAVPVGQPVLVEEPPGPAGSMAVMFGAGYWPELGRLEADGSLLPPDDLGDFKDWGFSFDTVFEGRVTQVGNAGLDLGLDLGFMSFENKEGFDVIVLPFGDVYEDRIYASLFYVTPSARLMFPVTRSSRAFTGLGLGYYLLTLEDSGYFYYSDSLTEDGAFGGFLTVGVDVFFGDGGVGLRLEDKLHYSDFGHISGFSNELDGFINTIEIGVVIAF